MTYDQVQRASPDALLARANKGAGSKPILEINLSHPLVTALEAARADKAEATDLSFLLLEQAQILDGELRLITPTTREGRSEPRLVPVSDRGKPAAPPVRARCA